MPWLPSEPSFPLAPGVPGAPIVPELPRGPAGPGLPSLPFFPGFPCNPCAPLRTEKSLLLPLPFLLSARSYLPHQDDLVVPDVPVVPRHQLVPWDQHRQVYRDCLVFLANPLCLAFPLIREGLDSQYCPSPLSLRLDLYFHEHQEVLEIRVVLVDQVLQEDPV